MHHAIRDRDCEVLSSLDECIVFYSLILHLALVRLKIDNCFVNVRRAYFYSAVHLFKWLLSREINDLQLVIGSGFCNRFRSFHLRACILNRNLLPKMFLDIVRKRLELENSILRSCPSEQNQMLLTVLYFCNELGVLSTSRLVTVASNVHF